MPLSMHHLLKRKRFYNKSDKNLKPYPHPNTMMRVLDRAILVVAVLGPISNIPQLYAIYSTQVVDGFSLTTWILHFTMQFFWITYAIVHRDLPILLTSILWACSHFLMIFGIIAYG